MGEHRQVETGKELIQFFLSLDAPDGQHARELGHERHAGAGVGEQAAGQAFHGDELNIRVAVTDIGRAGFTLIYLFERVSDGLQIGRIKNGMVFYDYQQQCVANTPAAFSAAFATTD